MEQIAADPAARHADFEWTGDVLPGEGIVGNQLYYVFALAMLLVYLCLAGQYESWMLPAAVILSAVPLALRSAPWFALNGGRARQQPLHPDRPDAADRARRQERHPDRRGGARTAHAEGVDIVESAIEAARTRFRPILMTSFAFILGVCRW
jgi:HAE1 family hydrophobic/amphiphilic exporter-1